MGYTVQPRPSKINYERRQMHTYYNKRLLGPRGSLLPCELKCPSNRSVLLTAPAKVSASTETQD